MVVRLAGLFLLALMSVAQARPLLVDDAQLSNLRLNAKAYGSLLKKCQKEQAEPTHAVVDFAPMPHYTAQGANPDDDQVKGLTGDIRRAYRAALCFRLSGDGAYAATTQKIADAWATTLKTASTAQGRSDINFNMAQLIVAVSWVDGSGGWKAEAFRHWLAQVILPLSLSTEPNNRGNWGNLLEVAIAAAAQDQTTLNKAGARWQQLIESQVAPDGTLPQEMCRSNSANHCDGPDKGVNGLAYTHYALLPATLALSLLQEAGEPVLKKESLRQKVVNAYGSALGFTLHPETFPYYAANQGKLNKADYCSYFPLLRRQLRLAGAALPNEREKACAGDVWLLMPLFGDAP